MSRAVTMIPATKNRFTALPTASVARRKVAGYACIQACPKMAIQFGEIPMKEPNPNARYRNPNITLTELVQANDQTRISKGVEL